MVSVIIVNYNGGIYTEQCLLSLKQFAPSLDYEVIIVDNNSADGSGHRLKKDFPEHQVFLLEQNQGFSSANNFGVMKACGDFLFFVNNDTLFTSDIITPLAVFMKQNETNGIAAPSLSNEDGSFQISYGKFPSLLNEWKTKREVVVSGNIEWVTGAAMMVRRSVFEQAGGFDEKYFMYFEDIDLCFRVLRNGFSIKYFQELSLIHLGGKSYDVSNAKIQTEYRKSQLRFYDKFRSIPQRIFLRIYLFLKFAVRFLTASGKKTSAVILASLFKSHG